MNTLLFDPFNGAAGDMIIGSLLDLGADEGLVRAAMRSVVAHRTAPQKGYDRKDGCDKSKRKTNLT